MTDAVPQAGTPLVTVIGEALIDLIPLGHNGFTARPGGSPFNVAVGLARLGARTALMARLADNAFGRILRDCTVAEGLDISCCPVATEPTTLAVVSLGANAQASYDFYADGTADWQWTAQEVRNLPRETAVLHFGSIASWTAPGSSAIDAELALIRERGDVLVSYDPNVRPSLLGTVDAALVRIEASVGRSHLVKASRDDVAWLYPGLSIDEVADRWLQIGALLVVITDGAQGAHGYVPDAAPVRRPGIQVEVADTVGAGDSFTAALLNSLARRCLHSPVDVGGLTPQNIADILDEAVLVSSITCEREGADPPRAATLTARSAVAGRSALVELHGRSWHPVATG